MYHFTTLSGSNYQVDAGRITRLNDTPILARGSAPVVNGVPFMWVTPPVVGRSCQYRLKGDPRIVTTSPVTDITPTTTTSGAIPNDRRNVPNSRDLDAAMAMAGAPQDDAYWH